MRAPARLLLVFGIVAGFMGQLVAALNCSLPGVLAGLGVVAPAVIA